MVGISEDDLARIVTAIESTFDCSKIEPEDSKNDYASLPLCVIDSVFSIGVKYAGASNAVRRWCDAQTPRWSRIRAEENSGRENTITEFLELAGKHSSEELASTIFQNRQRTSSKSGILKAEAVRRFCEVLKSNGIEKRGDTHDTKKRIQAEREVVQIEGQKSQTSWIYFLMLDGHTDLVKPDRQIQRFVNNALGATGHKVTAYEAAEGVKAASQILKRKYIQINASLLDSAIWKKMSGT